MPRFSSLIFLVSAQNPLAICATYFLTSPKKSMAYSLGMGPTLISYQEIARDREVARFSMNAVTGKFALQGKAFFPNGAWAANAFATLFSLSSTLSNVSVRYVGANLRLGYSLPVPRAPWKVTLSAGVYYSRMLVSQNALGYQDLLFPQLYPSVSRDLNSRNSLVMYFKYVPLGSEWVSLHSERELASGMSWIHQLSRGNKLIFGLDLSDLRLSPTPDHSFRTTTFGLSIGYGW